MWNAFSFFSVYLNFQQICVILSCVIPDFIDIFAVHFQILLAFLPRFFVISNASLLKCIDFSVYRAYQLRHISDHALYEQAVIF